MTNAEEFSSAPMVGPERAVDPFSSDLFAARGEMNAPRSPEIGSGFPAEAVIETDIGHEASWTARLPKVSRKLLESSSRGEALPDRLPDVLSKAVEEAVGEVVFSGSGDVRCRLESIAECDLFAELAASTKAGCLAIPIVFEPTRSYGSVTVGGGFVHRIIDKIFGPSGHESSNGISPVETAIVEFLAAKIVARVNDDLGEAFFSVGEASMTPGDLFGGHEAGVNAWVEVRAENFSQLFQVLISRDLLFDLTKTGSIFGPDRDERKAAKLFRTIRSVPFRAMIGSTHLDAAALAFLEPGDVVLVEESQLAWDRGTPRGELRLFAGAGSNVVLTGELETDNTSDAAGMRVLLKDISSREVANSGNTGRFNMQDKTSNEIGRESEADRTEKSAEPREGNEISASLENLQLRLRVELAGKKISLREINSLRAGQVIDLERGPTDSVNLVTDGSDETVAVGELVDIEGRLGVRLTKVFI